MHVLPRPTADGWASLLLDAGAVRDAPAPGDADDPLGWPGYAQRDPSRA